MQKPSCWPYSKVLNKGCRLLCTSYLQAYLGDKLGYQKEPIETDMTIALTDAGAVDGADIISEVRRACILGV